MDVAEEMLRHSAAGDGANRLINEAAAVELASVLPRVLIVSRRTVRKNKFVDFVGEYHLDLIVRYGAVPVIVPRVTGLHSLLDSFEPIHGVLLCEGEDIDPVHYDNNMSNLSAEEMEEIRRIHSSDTSIDKDKDSIELQLARLCLERNIPYLGICRGSQVLNVACGGSLYQDVEKELSSKVGVNVKHIDYENYDGHRHPVKVVKGTPLHEWFKTSLEEKSNDMELIVNSYHHQGVRRLAERFAAMAHAPDGLVEAFYDPDVCNPVQGKFIVGLQFHPERMRHDDLNDPSSEGTFDYPECPRVYQEFVGAVVAYQKRLLASGKERGIKIDEEMERQRQKLIRSFSIAKSIYEEEEHAKKSHESVKEGARSQSLKELEVGAQFLQMSTILDLERSHRLKQMGATVRSSSAILAKLRMNKLKYSSARALMQGMSNQDIMELLEFYKMMLEVGHEVLANRGLSIDHKTSSV